MEFPSLPSYWLSRNRKDLAERAIVTKREQEAQRLNHWTKISDNFRKAEIQTSIYSSLENTVYSVPPRANIESLKEKELQEAKHQELEKRRATLSNFLLEEEKMLQAELKHKQLAEKQADPWNIAKLKSNLEELQRKQEDMRIKMEEQRLRQEEERRMRKGETNARELEKIEDQLLAKEEIVADTGVEKCIPEHHRRRLDHRLW